MSAQSAIYNPTNTTSAASGDGFSTPRLTTTGRLAISFGTTDKGMMVYDTTLNNLFIWNGSAWESVPASGDAGANGSVQYNDNGVVSGAVNFVWDKTNNRVGIGTATPVNTLEVVAPAGDNIVSTFRSGDATAANNAGGGFRSISSATAANRVAQVWLDADGANFSGGDYFFIQKNGGSGTVEFNQSSNAAMVFLTNSTERMRIDSSGNVGIGGNASVTGIDTGVARLFVVAPNSNTGMAATFIADSVGRGLLVADQGKTNSFGVEIVAGLVKTGGFTSGTSVALFANAVERARVKSTGQVRFVPLAADPAGAEAGDVYYNSTDNKLKCYNGTTWNDLF